MARLSALRRVGRNATDIGAAAEFYALALGFEPVTGVVEDTGLAALLGVERALYLRMRLGGREIELSECFPAGAAYPEEAAAHDLLFQHIAIVTDDIAQAYRRALAHGAVAISNGGPQLLPASSGGVTAWKFRDPDGHPLEFLQFHGGSERSGYDHTAISVADVARSVSFYGGLGLSLGARSLNQGAAQDALDGLEGAVADVVALLPAQATPHVELLHYRAPGRAVLAAVQSKDVAADRMVFATDGGRTELQRDADGHFVLLEAES